MADHTKEPPTRPAIPALGMMSSGVPSAGPAICSSASMAAMGPEPQLTPRASTPASWSAAAAAAAVVPSATRRSSPTVSAASTGRSQARRAASTAASRWPTSLAVSMMTTSMPPSRRPSSCSLAAAPATRSDRWLGPCSGELTGPIDPATRTSRPATSRASRASWAARRLRRTVRSARPTGARRTRLAPKVSVSMRSAPAAMYSRWTAATSSGPAQHELIERGTLGHAAAVEERAHGAVEQQWSGGQPLGEGAAGVRRGRGAHARAKGTAACRSRGRDGRMAAGTSSVHPTWLAGARMGADRGRADVSSARCPLAAEPDAVDWRTHEHRPAPRRTARAPRRLRGRPRSTCWPTSSRPTPRGARPSAITSSTTAGRTSARPGGRGACPCSGVMPLRLEGFEESELSMDQRVDRHVLLEEIEKAVFGDEVLRSEAWDALRARDPAWAAACSASSPGSTPRGRSGAARCWRGWRACPSWPARPWPA